MGKLSMKQEYKRAQKKRALARYYKMNSILGCTWAIFYVVIGGRKAGKSYSGSDFVLNKNRKLGENVKTYWMRISEVSTKAMLQNKADKLFDPDLKRKYNLDLTTKGMEVYNRGKKLITVCPLSQFGKLKGVGFYDKDFDGWYNIILDEFQLEEGEKATSFDILYNFIGMCENIARTTKSKIRVFLFGNTLEEASTILKAFSFLPEKFGRFYLKSKRCVIDNLEPTEEYLKDREGSIADILGGKSMSNYTNEMTKDRKLLSKERPITPIGIIKFQKDQAHWYTVWNGGVIRKYNGERLPLETDFAMRPYINSYFSREKKMSIIERYDARGFKFANLIVQSYFTDEMKQIRKS